jgi:hypothetical protein
LFPNIAGLILLSNYLDKAQFWQLYGILKACHAGVLAGKWVFGSKFKPENRKSSRTYVLASVISKTYLWYPFGYLKVIVRIVPDCMSKCVLKTRCRKTGFPLVYSMCTPTSPRTFYVRMYAGNVNVYYVGS